MRVLSIGNSFSADAQRYLNRTARTMGLNIECANLMIGGCSLESHYKNMLSGSRDYNWFFNGMNTYLRTSLAEGLLSTHWDVITLQQVSHESPYYEKYTPYIQELAAYARKCAPNAKILLHQTWSYENGSQRLCEELHYGSSSDMLKDIVSAYEKAARLIDADGIIPSGEMLLKLVEGGIDKIHRDTYHATLGAGRYALALLWIRMLCGVNVIGNQFSEFDEPITEEERQIIWKIVDSFDALKFD